MCGLVQQLDGLPSGRDVCSLEISISYSNENKCTARYNSINALQKHNTIVCSNALTSMIKIERENLTLYCHFYAITKLHTY